jgi:hypothetical protein
VALVLGIARRKSRSELVRDELGRSLEHFKQAATHAARGTGATIGPKIDTAMDRVQPAAGRVRDAASTGWEGALATLAPLAAAASDGARQASKETRKAKAKNMKALRKKTDKALGRKQTGRRASRLSVLLVAGAAAGAAGALVLRRRKRQQWNEYDPSRPAQGQSRDDALSPADAAFDVPAAAHQPPAGPPSSTRPQSFSSDRDPAVTAERVDQTSSAQHSPTVARMAGGGGQA